MNLFVDVDDTLVIYKSPGPNPYGVYMGEPWVSNEKLIAGIVQFAEKNPESRIIIWSGGGKEYVEMWTNRFGISRFTEQMTKDPDSIALVKEGDIIVDDMPFVQLSGRDLKTHRPNEWPESI